MGMLLIRGADIWDPAPRGRRDLLCGGGKILAVAESIEPPAGLEVEVVDGAELRIAPGLIDGHVHIAGAGGEGGPATRTPEMSAETLLDAGITTAIGLLGTDGVTRSMDALLMKAKGLRAEGVSCWIFSGAYQLPLPTLHGDIARDLALVEEVIGAGEVAIADHRSCNPTAVELDTLVRKVRLGAMLGGKAGVVHFHLGDGPGAFDLLGEIVASGEIPSAQLQPTHVNRTRAVFDQAKVWAQNGLVDITTSSWPAFPDEEVKPSRALKELRADGVPDANITMSTDAGGSLPEFDADGRLVRITTGDPVRLWEEIRDAIVEEDLSPELPLATATRNPATVLGLTSKGVIAEDRDADLLLLDRDWVRCGLVIGGVLRASDEHAPSLSTTPT